MIRQLMIDVMAAQHVARKEQCETLADALLDSSELKIILDLAAMVTKMTPEIDRWMRDAEFHYVVSVLLADWRSSR